MAVQLTKVALSLLFGLWLWSAWLRGGRAAALAKGLSLRIRGSLSSPAGCARRSAGCLLACRALASANSLISLAFPVSGFPGSGSGAGLDAPAV